MQVERDWAATAATTPLPGAQLVGMAVCVPSAWGRQWQPVLAGAMVLSLSTFMRSVWLWSAVTWTLPVSVSASQPSQ